MYTNRNSTPPRYHGLAYSTLRINDHTLDEHLASPSSAFPSPRARPRASQGLGALDSLPLELFNETLLHLDIRTLFDLRNVNHRASELVDALPQFKAVVAHAPNTIRGILQIGTGRWTTVETLYNKLCVPECEHCGDFGGYLYLITSRRVCFLCLTRLRQYLPLRIRAAKREFRLSKTLVQQLPLMQVVPGKYSPNEKFTPVAVLVDYESAFCAGTMQEQAIEHNLRNFDTATTRSTSITPRIQEPRTSPADARSGNPLRFVAVVHMPWFNTQSKELDWGLHCLGCKKSSRGPLHYRRRFWAASFDDHIRQYGTIKNGSHMSA
ncbi:ATP binding [Ascochyta rabiei]|uniref:ATP binding n=1 Tax=Didymella rabiei TaxID=5454 RepID=A0A162V700_DIDRA|nr:ATP binding [Ascochyta rabiei]